MNKNVLKGLTAIVPVAALVLNFVADYLDDKKRDETYVSKEEFDKFLNDNKESK